MFSRYQKTMQKKNSINTALPCTINLTSAFFDDKENAVYEATIFVTFESMTPCHDVPLVRHYLGSSPVHLTVLAATSQGYTTTP